ncbi:Plug domain-containing protein [Nitrosomonas sp.]|uniref:TonB-dependent receptor plug domain-containing protein n=1 Tax=Nitrosomonas sp. TaxID=42353 RepID=UPI00283B25AE|nr:Plug domain-containing protein [Nitrosomonas sp.]MDR4513800.1 Plug domain-containing protein [Nitrosomonas sp.]
MSAAGRLFITKLIIVFVTSLSVSRTNAETSLHLTSHNDHTLIDLSIEELMNIEVTTVTRRSQKLTEIPSAVFVITQDDIKRSGATSIPEALRMAPGVNVARIGTDKWSISIRGFNGRFANKLQVLMDGRSVYNPLFAGIQWDQQDTLMEDKMMHGTVPEAVSAWIIQKISINSPYKAMFFSMRMATG